MNDETKPKSDPNATQNSDVPKKPKLRIKTSVKAPAEEPMAPCKGGHMLL